MVTKEIRIDQLTFDPEVLARRGVILSCVEEYAEDLKNGANFPAVDVMNDGDNSYLCDGNLRVNANLKNGKTTIMANVHEGTRRDGILLSCKANTKHGKRRSGGETKEMILRLLKDEEWQQWSAAVIAEKCGASRQYVNQVKRELSTGNGFQLPTTTKGKDGKVRNTENIGKNQGPSEEKLKKTIQEKAELKKQEELKKAEELKKQEELKKKEEELKRQEKELTKKQEELEKLEKKENLKKQEELKKQAELRKQEEQKKKEKLEQEKLKKEEELKKKEDELRKQEKIAQKKVAQEKQVALSAESITSNVKADAEITLLKQRIQDLEDIVIDKDKRIFCLEKQTDDYQSLIAELQMKICELESEKEGLELVNPNLQQESHQIEPETV